MIKLTTFFLVFLINIVVACEIDLPKHILILGEGPDFSQKQEAAACSEGIFEAINSTLKEVDGKVTAYQLEELLLAKMLTSRSNHPWFKSIIYKI